MTKKMYRMKYRTITAPITSAIGHEISMCFLAEGNSISDALTYTNYRIGKETRAVNIPQMVLETTDAMREVLTGACDISDAINARGNGYVDVLEDLNLTGNKNPDENPYSVDLAISYLLNAIYANKIAYQACVDNRDYPNIKAGDLIDGKELSDYFLYNLSRVFYITADDVRSMVANVIDWVKNTKNLRYGFNTLSCQVSSQTVLTKTITYKEV